MKRLAILLLLAAACRETSGGRAPEAPPAGRPAGERCEHALERALCPKCNPRLAAVYQAKGDWCDEHGFPESFCPLCKPALGGKPPAEATGAADGTVIRLKTAEEARRAGIATVKAAHRPGGARVQAQATFAFDATRRAEVNARAPGVVVALRADLGSRVSKGAPLAIIESASVGADQGRLAAAQAQLRLAEAAAEREGRLAEQGVTARREAESARQAVEAARAEVSAARAALGMVGGAEAAGRYTLTAPLAGTILRREATIGRLVGPEAPLFEIADTTALQAEIDVPERAASRLREGQDVVLTPDGGAPVEGRLTFIAPLIDPQTRTVRARATVPNPEGRLRAGQLARAEIRLGASAEVVVVPREALQRAGADHFVFVRTSESTFVARRVAPGAPVEDDGIELLDGLRAGEEVATTGSFLLKTEILKGSIGAGCCGD